MNDDTDEESMGYSTGNLPVDRTVKFTGPMLPGGDEHTSAVSDKMAAGTAGEAPNKHTRSPKEENPDPSTVTSVPPAGAPKVGLMESKCRSSKKAKEIPPELIS